MAETYCGKSCSECAERARFNCPGCRVGPGRAYTGECSISKCCNTRGHHSCESCTSASTCPQLRKRGSMVADLEYAKQREQAELRRRVSDSIRLGKGLTVLFWITIMSIIVNAVLEFMSLMPEVSISTEWVSILFGAAFGAIFISLRSVSYCFKMSAIFRFISVGLIFVALLPVGTTAVTVLTLISLVPSFISEYQEYMGYIEVTHKHEEELSEKWSKLWIWAFISLICAGVGLLFAMFGSGLGALLVLAASVVTIVVSIMKVVYLYRTANEFRSFGEEYQYSV